MALELNKFFTLGLKLLYEVKQCHCRLLCLVSTTTPTSIRHYCFHPNPNVFLHNTLICSMVSNDIFPQAILLYTSMHQMGLTSPSTSSLSPSSRRSALDSTTSTSVLASIRSSSRSGLKAMSLFRSTLFVFTQSRNGVLCDARKVFDESPEKNVMSWTVIICGWKMDDGYIKESGLCRNLFVATLLVDIYAKCRSMKEAQRVFDGMIERDVRANVRLDCYAMLGVFLRVQVVGDRNHLRHDPDVPSLRKVLETISNSGGLTEGNGVPVEAAGELVGKLSQLGEKILNVSLPLFHAHTIRQQNLHLS
ncbi:hypothetical protein VNO78_15267 [Psophocarpus tetragonolobus]|uniref:Pentatricopeptide repeat-containing protein n=1 Tax=Psophocarpus tetragonolobus TaxID=3891 RepID=A0AAN9SF25_PSOTE